MVLERFRQSIGSGDRIARLRAGLIGEGAGIETPFGEKRLIYADYTASGRALRQVEEFIARHVLPYYANSHTEASFCGAYTTRLREEARAFIAAETNAGSDYAVIFAGSGATSAVNRLVALCGVGDFAGARAPSPGRRLTAFFRSGRRPPRGGGRPAVFVGPYEHHSNILPWRESGAEVIEIAEAPGGGPDLAMLERELTLRAQRPLLIGSFSAASNVTGIITDVDAVTRLLKHHGALAFWDYAGGGPYLPIDMNPGAGLEKDAVFLSPHKFQGGPGASGLLIVRRSAIRATRPTWPGGGSVAYVSPWAHDYLDSVIEREEAGTPNILGDIRAALAFMIKAEVGTDTIRRRDDELIARAEAVWGANPHINLLGVDKAPRLPIFSFTVRDQAGAIVHHQLFTRLLSDIHGIQVRGGCVCAGPYGHRLLHVSRAESERIRDAVRAGQEVRKPGWIRLNFNYLMDDATAAHIVESVERLARGVSDYAPLYAGDETTAEFHYMASGERHANLAAG